VHIIDTLVVLQKLKSLRNFFYFYFFLFHIIFVFSYNYYRVSIVIHWFMLLVAYIVGTRG